MTEEGSCWENLLREEGTLREGTAGNGRGCPRESRMARATAKGTTSGITFLGEAVSGAGQTACEVPGLDAGKDGGWLLGCESIRS